MRVNKHHPAGSLVDLLIRNCSLIPNATFGALCSSGACLGMSPPFILPDRLGFQSILLVVQSGVSCFGSLFCCTPEQFPASFFLSRVLMLSDHLVSNQLRPSLCFLAPLWGILFSHSSGCTPQLSPLHTEISTQTFASLHN
jgi:hypothetical protein